MKVEVWVTELSNLCDLLVKWMIIEMGDEGALCSPDCIVWVDPDKVNSRNVPVCTAITNSKDKCLLSTALNHK